MSKTRNLSDLLDANGDVKSTALDNVPPSNDASALTTGTLPNARLSAVPNSALANSSITINGSATSLGGSATINTDLVNDTTPQLGGTLDTNGNPINFGDNDKAQFGASQDLKIYHDGSNSRIEDRGTGNLLIGSNGGGITLKQKTDAVDENLAVFTNNSSVDLYYNGAKKLETTSSGATVTGTLTATAFSGDGSALTNVPAGVSSVKTVVFTSSGTYTPTSGTKFVTVYATGAGGGGGGFGNSNQQENQLGGAGGGGGTGIRTYNSTELGSSASVTIGSGGSGGGAGSNGGTGGNSSFNPAGTGVTLTGTGGDGGYGGTRSDGSATAANGIGGHSSNGQINIKGENGSASGGGLVGDYNSSENNRKIAGQRGGSSMFGATSMQLGNRTSTTNGSSGSQGSGGNGGIKNNSGSNCSGGAGGSGVVVIMEFA